MVSSAITAVVNFVRRSLPALLISAGLGLAVGAGFLTEVALGVGTQGTVKTTTINVATGPTGPAGPPGPPGPKGEPGASSCPTGFEPGEVVINHPGGQTVIWTCIQ